MERPTRTVEKTDVLDFDRGTLEHEQLVRGGVTAFEAPLLAMYRGPVRPSARAVAAATVGWFSLVFMLCYVALPALAEMTGLYPGLWISSLFSVAPFAATAFVAAVGASLVRPEISGATRDPVLSATLGGLAMWAVAHNVSPALRPFWEMSAVELPTFLAINVVEMFLIGSMLASLTRSRLGALVLGGSFQLVYVGLFVTVVRLFG